MSKNLIKCSGDHFISSILVWKTFIYFLAMLHWLGLPIQWWIEMVSTVAQVVEYLPSKHEALMFKSRYHQKKKKKYGRNGKCGKPFLVKRKVFNISQLSVMCHTSSHFCFSYFLNMVLHFYLELDSSYLCLSHNWNHRHAPPCPVCWLRWV
jgi:hypothetical protein